MTAAELEAFRCRLPYRVFIRVLVTGGRFYYDKQRVFDVLDAIEHHCTITRIVQGGATGADALALRWAIETGKEHKTYPALWKVHGRRRAGGIRNALMLREECPDLVVAFPGGSGTANMIGQSRAKCVATIEVSR
jgi:hypothetical protein